MRNVHDWKSVTPEGEKREMRAEKFGGNWRIQSRLKGSTYWLEIASPTRQDLVELRDIIWRKYQRKRLSWDDVQAIDDWLKLLGYAPAGEEEDTEGPED